MANFTLPYEPQCTAHRDAERRRRDVKRWLRRLEGAEASPSIVPERSEKTSVADRVERFKDRARR